MHQTRRAVAAVLLLAACAPAARAAPPADVAELFPPDTLAYAQLHDPANGRQQLSNDKPPTEGPHEATFAYVPGLILVGTGKGALAPIIERFQGKGKGSLRESPLFQAAAAAHRQPGLFFFADVPQF